MPKRTSWILYRDQRYNFKNEVSPRKCTVLKEEDGWAAIMPVPVGSVYEDREPIDEFISEHYRDGNLKNTRVV